MPCSLPPEILDLVVDQLLDEPATLKTCCLVSKSWIPRTRRHLFAQVEFDDLERPFESWMRVFPDPSNSPAHHTRTLSICDLPTSTPTGTDVGNWIRSFYNVVHFGFNHSIGAGYGVPLASFVGFSPLVRSVSLTSTSSKIFDLVCSFPLLEDLTLIDYCPEDGTVGWSTPSTSPKLTGSLNLAVRGGIHSTTRRLLDFPDGLHFCKITVTCIGEDFESATDLVSRCSDTLESLNIRCFLTVMPRGHFPDLSKASKLKDLMFLVKRSNIHWTTASLQTVKSKNLEQITIRLHTATLGNSTVEIDRLEWQDLDRLLVQFWTSHSIRPRLVYGPNSGGWNARDHAQSLLPELTRRGLVDLVEYSIFS